MSFCRVLFLLFFLLLISQGGEASSWRLLEKGLSYKKIEIKKRSSKIPSAVHVFKIDPKRFDFRIVTAAPETYATVRRMAEASGAVIAVNANFFDPEGKPLGLLIDQGKQLNPKKDISWWGIFYIDRKIPHIVHSNQWKSSRSISTAVQAGPRLVVNGKIPRLKKDSSQKTAVGITKSGDVILATTLFPLEITELARLMGRSEAKGGLGCLNALNLDGGSSSQLYAKIGSFELRLPSYIGVPVGLGVFRNF